MPPLSRWMLRCALINAWLGFGLASALLMEKGQPHLLPMVHLGWVLSHVSLLLVGWMVQLAMGVSYWIFPRLPNTITQRGRYGVAVLALVSLNGGVWGYAIGMIVMIGWLEALGLTVQLVAILAYAYHSAPRIRRAITSKKRH